MGLLKASSAAAASAYSMRDIEQEAEEIVRKARLAAGRLLADARHTAEAMRQRGLAQGLEEGRRQGREEGFKAGRDQAVAEHRQKLILAVQAFSAAAQAIEDSRCRLESEGLEDVIRLAIEIARRVCRIRGQADPRVTTAAAVEALRIASHASDVRVAVHPSQKATLESALPQIRTQLPTLGHVAIVEDASLPPGGCRLYTAAGLVDADLETQIERIAAELLPEAATP